MFIEAWCPKCDWKGIAEVGHGLKIENYECPKCGYIVKRPYRGGRDLTQEMAKLRKRPLSYKEFMKKIQGGE